MANPTPHIDAQFKALVAQDPSTLDKFLARLVAGDTVTTAKHTAMAKFKTPALDADKAQYTGSGGL